jgi:hypothetical protein
VEDVEQGADVILTETPTEVAGCSRVGNAASAQGVEEDLVIAPQFDVLEAGSFTKSVVGEVQDMIGFMEGEVDFEEMQPPIDVVDEA